eukprot:CAMPEP_0185562752 /NCGR_PEP_ID=MMETSP1381-20130426/62082_1 /TAXON_ID=298111 /ORGANISM="Pavlova sp., Strain CCMP459" /LENGTH=109 /DNA_ID=CAMNT_0028176599 /DNA_START=387 /DNA_END=714 /DNA_ORIENTATION=-
MGGCAFAALTPPTRSRGARKGVAELDGVKRKQGLNGEDALQAIPEGVDLCADAIPEPKLHDEAHKLGQLCHSEGTLVTPRAQRHPCDGTDEGGLSEGVQEVGDGHLVGE